MPCLPAPMLQLGGFEGAKQGLAEGRLKPEQFKVLTRYAGAGLLCLCACVITGRVALQAAVNEAAGARMSP